MENIITTPNYLKGRDCAVEPLIFEIKSVGGSFHECSSPLVPQLRYMGPGWVMVRLVEWGAKSGAGFGQGELVGFDGRGQSGGPDLGIQLMAGRSKLGEYGGLRGTSYQPLVQHNG